MKHRLTPSQAKTAIVYRDNTHLTKQSGPGFLLFANRFPSKMSKAGALDLASGVGGNIEKDEILSAVDND
ncbi:hypothetical protein L2E82_30320 [Cichorium intybus]|uniref:Uncharacterized protein n=1 Tax=Cichorium intybus TaxID=13427 RepID=A0ACB9D0H6_CICIN|nr:hypothetical protein L2E82_30320 [Cichorium intybus]